MGYFIVILILLLFLYILILDGSRDRKVHEIIAPAIIAGIIILIISFSLSDFICDQHVKNYEKGKVIKEYTIRDSDTTYKWIYYKN